MRNTLSDIIKPWVEKLDLVYSSDHFIRGESHWYTKVRKPDAAEDWVMTVRDRYVEIRSAHDGAPEVLAWHTLEASDPEFFVKLERDIRAALDYLSEDSPSH
jgi:hypothetical protein